MILAGRALGALEKLRRHDTNESALTGGLAFEIHGTRLGLDAPLRPLNDLDFVAASFDLLPDALARDFLFRHIHPLAASGKMMVQLIDPENALRIDVFRAQGATMSRTVRIDVARRPLEVVSIEDLIARAARLLLDLAGGAPVAAKHARDYIRFIECVVPDRIEAAWRDHRKPGHPAVFADAEALVDELISARGDLLIVPRYSQDPHAHCLQCLPTPAFQLADPKTVLSLLGYC